MVVGGGAYRLADLDRLAALPAYSCGLPGLDGHTGGGLLPGSVWTVAAPSGGGATTFAVQLAVAAARSGSVLVVNDHVATHLLRDRLRAALRRIKADDQSAARIRVSTWMPLPRWDSDRLEWQEECTNSDVVVLDTIEEIWLWRSPTASDWWSDVRGRMRDLRLMARRTNTAVLLTARVAYDGRSEKRFRHAWRQHWCQAAFAEIADVRIQIGPERDGERHVHAYLRGGGYWACDIGPLGSSPHFFHAICPIAR